MTITNLAFRLDITQGWTQTEIELILCDHFKVLRFIGKAARNWGHIAGFGVHRRQVDIVRIIFSLGNRSEI